MSAAIDKVVEIIESIAPKDLAFDWDNTGLLLRCSDNVDNLLICLDVTQDIVNEAVQKGCDMILSHHPLIFSPLDSISINNTTQSVVINMIKNDISLYCAHTSYDKAVGGINDVFANKMGLTDVQIICGEGEDIMRVGRLPKTFNAEQLAEHVKCSLNVKRVKVSDISMEDINSIAVFGGSGGDFVMAAKNAGAKALVTGETKHKHYLEARGLDMLLIEAGHFETEQFFAQEIFCSLQSRINEVQLALGLKRAECISAPYKII